MKNIVLLSDGTGNSAAKKNKTNVWRLYQALDLHDKYQIAMYEDGVGSQENTVLKVLGGVFGYGLRRNVIEMYKYLCRNYRDAATNQNYAYATREDDNDSRETLDVTAETIISSNETVDVITESVEVTFPGDSGEAKTPLPEEDDRIYMFGFSRGAFTVRVLASLVADVGLCTQYKDEQELDAWAHENYRYHCLNDRDDRNKQGKGKIRGLLSLLWTKLFSKTPVKHSDQQPDIHFVGVWDTVDAYGFPIDEIATLWDRLIYPIRFPDQELSPKVLRACHAISVDDERQTFHPVLWNEANEKTDRIEQVWFPGVHTDVGGGYPRKSLSLVTLDWMMSRVEAEVTDQGLVFVKSLRDLYTSQSDWNGPQHDSRAGLALYYRYKPRNIDDLCNDPHAGVTISTPKLHRSVLERIKGRSLPYAPTGIPAHYEVVATGDEEHDYESADQASKRAESLNHARDIIFWRRRLYIALLFTTLALIASRFFLEWDKGGICIGTACAIDPLLQVIINTLPDFVVAWPDALRQNPNWLWGFAILFAVLFLLRRYASYATRAAATCAWSNLLHGSLPPAWKPTFTSRLRGLAKTPFKTSTVWLGAIAVFALILYLLVAVANGIVFHLRYTFGTLCDGSGSTQTVSSPVTVNMDVMNACSATGIKLEKGVTYRFVVPDVTLHDGDKFEANPDGITPTKLFGFVPFRRHLGEPWFKLHGKIDDAGFETFPLGAGSFTYTARSDGELYLYVNDAVFGLLPAWDLPYRWERGRNTGTLAVTISKE